MKNEIITVNLEKVIREMKLDTPVSYTHLDVYKRQVHNSYRHEEKPPRYLADSYVQNRKQRWNAEIDF